MAGLGRDDRPVAALVVARRSGAARSASKATDAGDRLGGDRQRGAVAPGALGRLPLDLVDQRRPSAASVEQRASSQAVTRDGTALVPLGVDVDPAEGRALAGQPGLLVGGQRGHRVGQHRVVPVLHPGGAGVVGLAGEVEAVAAVRPDLAGHPDRRAAVDEVAALLDVQLDEACRPSGQQRPAEAGSSPATPSRRAGDAVAVAQLARLRPSESRRSPAASPRQASPNREPSSSTNTATPIGRAGTNPALAQQVDRRQRGHHAQRAVVRPAVEHRVEVRAGQHRRGPGSVAGRRPPPGDQVADAVGLDAQAAAPRTARGTTRALALGAA